jgi:hypothetical protein
MSDLSLECAPKRTSADHSELWVRARVADVILTSGVFAVSKDEMFILMVRDARKGALLTMRSAPVAVLFLADVLDRDHVLVLGGVEHDHALGGAAGDADAFDRAADQLALVGHQHDLV